MASLLLTTGTVVQVNDTSVIRAGKPGHNDDCEHETCAARARWRWPWLA